MRQILVHKAPKRTPDTRQVTSHALFPRQSLVRNLHGKEKDDMERQWNECLMDDHQAAERVIAALEVGFASQGGPKPALVGAAVDFFTQYLEGCHHQKEERYLFPLLESRGVPRQGGPLAVMLAEHEKNRELLREFEGLGRRFAAGEVEQLAQLRDVFSAYAELMKQHFWKENDILFPMGLRVLDAADGQNLLQGFADCEGKLGGDTRHRYHTLAERLAQQSNVQDLSVGLDPDVLACILNTLPVELSFVDANDTVRYFSHENGDKIFPRNRSAIGMKVENCHPQKSVHKVKSIIESFRDGSKNSAEFWIDFASKKVHIRYFAVRDAAGTYLGCLEVVQDITPIQAIAGQKRLLD